MGRTRRLPRSLRPALSLRSVVDANDDAPEQLTARMVGPYGTDQPPSEFRVVAIPFAKANEVAAVRERAPVLWKMFER